MSAPLNSVPQSSLSSLKLLDDLSVSPYPAVLLGSSLILKGAASSKPSPVGVELGSSVKISRALAVKPSRASCFTFGAANLLGAWVIYDGEPINGAGFNFAWSSLYLIVNGTASFKSLFRGKVSPLALSVLALGNAGLYGKKFFWPSNSLAQF